MHASSFSSNADGLGRGVGFCGVKQRSRGAAAHLLMLGMASCLVLNKSVPAICEQTRPGRPALVRSLTWPVPYSWEQQLRDIDAAQLGVHIGPSESGVDMQQGTEQGAGASPKRAGGTLGGMKRTDEPARSKTSLGGETDWQKSMELRSPQLGAKSLNVSPLAESIEIMKEQERLHLTQAARCRSAMRRMLMLDRIAASRDQYHSNLLPPAIAREIAAWQACGKDVEMEIRASSAGAHATMAKILDNAAAIPPGLISAEKNLHEQKSRIRTALSPSTSFGDMLTDKADAGWDEELEKRLSRRRWQQPYERDSCRDQVHLLSSIPAGDTPLPQHLEEKFRVGTWADIPVYGISKTPEGNYEYAQGTELHVIWDVDQSKLVGEGTNDVELVLKCVLWWKEELEHDKQFIPHEIDECIRLEFTQFCKDFDMVS